MLLRLLSPAAALNTEIPLNPGTNLATSDAYDDRSSMIGTIDVILYLNHSADLENLPRAGDKMAQRTEVISRLKAAAAQQAPLIGELDRLKWAGVVQRYRPFWIINAIGVTIDPDALPALEAWPTVARVELDRQHDVFGEPTAGGGRAPDDGIGFGGLAAAPGAARGRPSSWGIERIRAPHVWDLLGIDGKGITVAIVDTGVDWQHPALSANYRGGQGAEANHAGNWYHAASPTQTIPIDPHGHGTHVAGTAVGRLGIGVAPGANWIAVAIADSHGLIRDSDIHAAFEWLLAPDGKPELAPDVVNNSWGTSGSYTAYVDDIRALDAAGIITVFAAGNNGPDEGTILAPASYPGTIAVAAEDDSGTTTWFSSRGPSPLTTEPKPLISAPGAQILSAYPDGRYALFNGTSMATPHVVGTIALMLSAEARLAAVDITTRLSAAGNPFHDLSRGWGRLDAYASVAPLVEGGQLLGRIAGKDGPIAGAEITITPPSGQALKFTADAQGNFKVAARPGLYDIRVTAFGYHPSQKTDFELISGHALPFSIELQPHPTQKVSINLSTNDSTPISNATVGIVQNGNPVPTPLDYKGNGQFEVELPLGQYTLEARAPSFRLHVAELTVEANSDQVINIALEPGPRLLLIDSGRWQYRSQAEYYDLALRDLGYFADRWTIDSPVGSLPGFERLKEYEAVIWSAPFDSPGYLGANDVITDYLDFGGRLLISGQNVGSKDGSHATLAVWWNRDLEGRWLAKTDTNQGLVGAAGTPFSNLTLSLNGEDSAQNQTTPDQVGILDGSLTQPVLYYEDGTAAALSANRCKPYRLLYLGFGLEGVSGQTNRAALMQAILDTLLEPTAGREAASWQPTTIDDFAIGGDRPVYTITLHNLNHESTQTFAIEAMGGAWPRTVLTPTLTIGPCESGQTAVALDVPRELPRGLRHEMTIRADVLWPPAPQSPPAVLTMTATAPGSILLVDDDRFYHTQDVYRHTLDQLGLVYDVWETGWGDSGRGSPRAELLRAYDLVLWFTGYDWYQPVTDEEDEALAEFLEGGGRLYLSSQDYLIAHQGSANPRDYFGIAGFQDSITPTQVFFGDQSGAGSLLGGPLTLRYGAYRNFSDGLIPIDPARSFVWHDRGALAGTATSGVGHDGRRWRAVFWAFPFETLPVEARVLALRAVLDQLSDVGDSQFSVNQRSAPAAEPRTYTITVTNSADSIRHLWLTNTLPAELDLLSAADGLVFDRDVRRLLWDGVLRPGDSRVLHYSASVASVSGQGAGIDNTVAIRTAPISSSSAPGFLADYVLTRTVTTWIDAPALNDSTLQAAARIQYAEDLKGNPAPVQVITYSLILRNSSLDATGPMSASIAFAGSLDPLEKSVGFTFGTAQLTGSRLVWLGAVGAGDSVTSSLTLTQTAGLDEILPAAAYINDGATQPIIRPLFFAPLPHRSYWPLIIASP